MPGKKKSSSIKKPKTYEALKEKGMPVGTGGSHQQRPGEKEEKEIASTD